MLNQKYGICIGLGVAFAAGLWLGSVHPSMAETPLVGGPNVRYLLSAASDGGMFMIDTSNSETWTLVMGDAKPVKQWVKLKNIEPVPKRAQ
jgi:hypothetical protein